MIIQYQYPDTTRGPARQFLYDGNLFPVSYLAQREGETDAEWSARLDGVSVIPIRITPSEADPNLFDAGVPAETVTDGVIIITYSNPVGKVPVWSTATREQMHVSAGADVPPGYTTFEPLYGGYSSWDAVTEAWTEDTDRKATDLRSQRDRLLAECDWTQLADSPLAATATAAWSAYRQDLRDVPQQNAFPESVTWPVKPE